MTETKNKMTGRKVLQILGLFLFLVILPGGSWLYLQRGLDYRIATMEELKSLGTAQDFALHSYTDSVLTSTNLQGQVSVIGYLPDAPEQEARMIEVLFKLHDQFNERDDLTFLTFTQPDSLAILQARAKELELKDGAQWFFGPSTEQTDDLAGFLKDRLYFPEEMATQAKKHPYFALLDTNRVVRRFYDGMENKEMGRLIEHIAMLLPRKPDKDIIFKREPEK